MSCSSTCWRRAAPPRAAPTAAAPGSTSRHQRIRSELACRLGFSDCLWSHNGLLVPPSRPRASQTAFKGSGLPEERPTSVTPSRPCTPRHTRPRASQTAFKGSGLPEERPTSVTPFRPCIPQHTRSWGSQTAFEGSRLPEERPGHPYHSDHRNTRRPSSSTACSRTSSCSTTRASGRSRTTRGRGRATCPPCGRRRCSRGSCRRTRASARPAAARCVSDDHATPRLRSRRMHPTRPRHSFARASCIQPCHATAASLAPHASNHAPPCHSTPHSTELAH